MYADEIATSASLVRSLLEAQFPHWADALIEPVRSAGTDNALYRLGTDKLVRLPRVGSAALQIEKQHTWLPVLGPDLPLETPTPLALGAAAPIFPWQWSVYGWIEGEVAELDRLQDASHAAHSLGQFISALHRIEPQGALQPGEHNAFRGVPLQARDSETRLAIAALDAQIDAPIAMAAWESALAASPRCGSMVTCSLPISWHMRASCVPSSTSASWPRATRPAI